MKKKNSYEILTVTGLFPTKKTLKKDQHLQFRADHKIVQITRLYSEDPKKYLIYYKELTVSGLRSQEKSVEGVPLLFLTTLPSNQIVERYRGEKLPSKILVKCLSSDIKVGNEVCLGFELLNEKQQKVDTEPVDIVISIGTEPPINAILPKNDHTLNIRLPKSAQKLDVVVKSHEWEIEGEIGLSVSAGTIFS
jgi:hypothetical protein